MLNLDIINFDIGQTGLIHTPPLAELNGTGQGFLKFPIEDQLIVEGEDVALPRDADRHPMPARVGCPQRG